MFDMNTAPLDGTRILVKSQVREVSDYNFTFTIIGTKWVDAWFKEGRWNVWCGKKNRSSTEFLDPIGWLPLPEEP